MIIYSIDDIRRLNVVEMGALGNTPSEYGLVDRHLAYTAIRRAYLDGLRAGVMAMRNAGAECCERYGVDPDPT